jgi:hypothetical protein
LAFNDQVVASVGAAAMQAFVDGGGVFLITQAIIFAFAPAARTTLVSGAILIRQLGDARERALSSRVGGG